MDRKRVLLGHLNSNGDCLLATVIARQIKEADYPNCHLTWAVNSRCKQSVFLNPYVDDIWEVPTEKTLTTETEWDAFLSLVEDKKKNGEFDFVFLTQILGENKYNYDGGIRTSTYNNYPHEIAVSHEPIIRLSDAEVERVRQFADRHEFGKYKQIVLVECGPDSFDVALNPQSAYEFASGVTFENKEVAIVLSSNKPIAAPRPNIIDASVLSYRENAELTKYCDLLIGCGSGITWLATTDWAKKLNMILVVNQDNAVLPSVIYDHDYLNLPTEHIIEIKNNRDSITKLKDCLNEVTVKGFAVAREHYNETIELTNYDYLQYQLESSLVKLNFRRIFSCLRRSVRRNGVRFLFTAQFVKIIWNSQRVLAKELLKTLRLRKKD